MGLLDVIMALREAGLDSSEEESSGNWECILCDGPMELDGDMLICKNCGHECYYDDYAIEDELQEQLTGHSYSGHTYYPDLDD